MSKEKVILVDENDTQVGLMPKLEAHQKGLLHRAFSVFIFNSNHQLLLQKRAVSKYHSGGLWTNTCCSHPREGEETINAANRRLIEEMGIKTNLRKVFDFIYKAELDNELTENEFDHVFYGLYNEDPIINTEEADDFKWIDMETLNNDITLNGQDYTVWFKIAFDYFYKYLNNDNNK
jgi:isopentenyl-diphosphate delta-isomerase